MKGGGNRTGGTEKIYLSITTGHIHRHFAAIAKSLCFACLDQQHIDTFCMYILKSAHSFGDVYASLLSTLRCPVSFEVTWTMACINTGMAGITQDLWETLCPPGVVNGSCV